MANVTVEPEKADKDKRRNILLLVQVFGECENIEGKIGSELIALSAQIFISWYGS